MASAEDIVTVSLRAQTVLRGVVGTSLSTLVRLVQWLRLLALIPADGVQFPTKAAVFS